MKKYSLLAALLSAIILSAIIYTSQQRTLTTESISISLPCDLRDNTCALNELAQGSQVHISPLPIKALNQVKVELSNLPNDIDYPLIWFQGRHMEMGKHLLLRDKQAPTWNGSIPVCSIDPKMAWDLVVSFEQNGTETRLLINVPTTAHN